MNKIKLITKDILSMGYSQSNLYEAIDYSAKNLNLIILH